MELRKEDLEKKQDELADELCALLEKAGREGASSRVFEIPEYARRRIDVSPAKEKLTGYFKDLVINDWKRKDHHDGDKPEERMAKEDVLVGVAVFLTSHDIRIFTDDRGTLYVLGIERYGGIPVEGHDGGHLYTLYSPEHTEEAWHINSDGGLISAYSAEMNGKELLIKKGVGTAKTLAPFDLSGAAYLKKMKEKSQK